MSKRLFPTRRSGKMVDVDQTREVEGGLAGWAVDFDRATRRYVAVPIFIPNGDVE